MRKVFLSLQKQNNKNGIKRKDKLPGLRHFAKSTISLNRKLIFCLALKRSQGIKQMTKQK